MQDGRQLYSYDGTQPLSMKEHHREPVVQVGSIPFA